LRLRFAVAFLCLATSLSAQELTIRTIAGSTTGGGHNDGFRTNARFSVPRAIAADAAGNFYVADTGNHTIRRISSTGDVVTIAGAPGQAGFADGQGPAARFRFPAGIAVDPVDGMIWISDKDNHVIRLMTPNGTVTTIAGSPGVAGSADAQGTNARFAFPRGLVVDNSGVAYVADTQNHVIRRVTRDGVAVTFAGAMLTAGSSDGLTNAARFNRPSDIALDPTTGNFFIADLGNHRIRAMTAIGNVTTFAGSQPGNRDDVGTAASFSSPWGLDVDNAGNVYVADHDNHSLRRITPGRLVTTLARDFNHPSGVAFGRDGAIYLTDGFHHAIRRIALPGGEKSTLAGSIARATTLSFPYGVAADAAGNIYVAEGQSVRRISPSGAMTTILSGLTTPSGLAIGPDNSLYVVDVATALVMRVWPTGQVTTVAGGSGVFTSPWAIAADSQGFLYVTDLAEDKIHLIDPAGNVATFAGTGSGGYLDGNAATARFREPAGIAVDAARNVYVADFGNHVIRKITQAGIVTTLVPVIAGLNGPTGIASTANGTLYVSDYNHAIYRVTPGGVVSLAAGLPGTPGNLDGTGTRARFSYPEGLAIGPGGSLLIADSFSHAVRIGTVFVGPDRRRIVRH
jgi:sugar lactone lactonase YvrE